MEAYIPYRNNAVDATGNILKTREDLFRKGFVTAWNDLSLPGRRNEQSAPYLEPVPGLLQVRVISGLGIGWVALGADGLLVKSDGSDGPWTLTITAGVKYYITLRIQYVAVMGGEIYEFGVFSDSGYTASAYKDSLLIVGTVQTAPGAIEAVLADFSYAERHRVEGLFDSNWRPSVSTYADLPLATVPDLKVGDCILVRSSLSAYIWNGTIWWCAWGVAALNSHYAESENDRDLRRALHGSGIIAGDTATDFAYGEDLLLSIHAHPSTGTRLGLGEIRCLVNGHYIRTRMLDVDLAAKPGIGTRYDLVYLECYRREIVSPESWGYSGAGGGTLTGSQISLALETLTNSASHADTSFDITSVEVTPDGHYVANFVSIRTVDDVSLAEMADIYDPAAMAATPMNSDGVAWGYSTAQADTRLWLSAHTGSYDGVAWGMPLCVVYRRSTENPGVGDGIQLYSTTGSRWVFPIYPVANLGPAGRDADRATRVALSKETQTLPSGLLTDTTFESKGGLVMGFDRDIVVNVRGYRLVIPQASSEVTLNASPAAGGYRSCVVLQVSFVACPDMSVPPTNREIIALGEYHTMPYSAGYVREIYADIKLIDVGSVSLVEDTPEAMAAAGYSATSGDLGLWEYVPGTFDPRVILFGTEYAIPICLISRFNSLAFDAAANPNGGLAGSRPDGYAHDDIAWSITPLFHRVGLGEADIRNRMEATARSLMLGQLDTLMARHPVHADVAGNRLTIGDAIASLAVLGYSKLTADPDGWRHCWSEAEEVRPFGLAFDPTGNFTDGVHTWAIGIPGHMRIQAPVGMSIYVADTTSPTDGPHFLLYSAAGPPAHPYQWDNLDTAIVSCTTANVVINAVDGDGYPIDMELDLTTPDNTLVHFYYWMIHRRSDTDIQHTDNGGLTRVPNRMFCGTWGPLGVGNVLGVNPMVADITVSAFSGAVLTLVHADLEAAVPESGAAYFLGFLGVTVIGVTRASYTYGVTISDDNQTLEITFGAPIVAHDVHVMVAYDTADADRWVEVTRGSRCITGFYKFYTHDWTGQITAGAYLSGSTNAHFLRFVCLLWRDTATADPWDVIPYDQYTMEVYEGVDGGRLSALTGGYQSAGKDYRAVFVTITPPAAAAEDILVWYENTPYQGMSAKDCVVDKVAYLKGILQGEVICTGKTFLSTFGRLPQYIHPETMSEANNMQQAYDYTGARFQFAGRAKALASSGTSFWRSRMRAEVSGKPYFLRSILKTLQIGYDGMLDHLPWPNWNIAGDLYATGGGVYNWFGVVIAEWELTGREIPLGSADYASGGALVMMDDSFSGEQIGGAHRPVHGAVIEYRDYASHEAAMDSASFADATRGVAVTLWEYDGADSSTRRFVADGVAYLPFGNLEGLLSTEILQGVVGWELLPNPPTYLHPGIPFRLRSESSWFGNYYGGHYMVIGNSGTPILQVSGAPKSLSGIRPRDIYAPQIGGVFEAYYLIGRPLLSK